MVTCASMAAADALLIVNNVLAPAGLARSTSKYGSSKVAAGWSVIDGSGCASAGATHMAPSSRAASSGRIRNERFVSRIIISATGARASGDREMSRVLGRIQPDGAEPHIV